jgi:ketosteroid isomerase-like protein
MSGAIEERVARLEAIQAIQNLKNTYHAYVNDTAFDKVPDLFTKDAYVHFGYLMPGGQPLTGREQIRAAFSSMKSTSLQSQVKQFPHAHVIEITGDGTASGTSQLLATYGVGEDSYIVAGKYEETYVRNAQGWLIKSMRLRLHFSVPLSVGWAGVKRHYLVNSGAQVPDYLDLTPNAPL